MIKRLTLELFSVIDKVTPLSGGGFFVLDQDIPYLVWFQSIPGIGPATLETIFDYFGSYQEAWQAPEGELLLAGIPERVLRKLAVTRGDCQPQELMTALEGQGVKIAVRGNSNYPKELLKLKTAPWIIFYQGEIALNQTAIAVVGTRQPTGYGEQVTTALVADLVRCGFAIVSGLAKGIDSFAHHAALVNQGRTLAVLAGGINHLYPESSQDLAKLIVSSGGGLLSESGLGALVIRTSFPIRNRLVAALSSGVVVVEAGYRSGAKNTAWWARQLQIPVMAVPGLVTSDQSAGCHDLIKQGANLVTSTQDILKVIN